MKDQISFYNQRFETTSKFDVMERLGSLNNSDLKKMQLNGLIVNVNVDCQLHFLFSYILMFSFLVRLFAVFL